tara:strand:- start:134 stop:559 length:426 start_codon:yes stop_codon:yes gene_type:complete
MPTHMKKTTIGKGTSKERKVPQRYIPKNLSPADKKKQEKSILEGKKRPKLDSFKSKRSSHTADFEKKYGYKISNLTRISKEIISREGINQIIKKGEAAYYNSGSRPNQTARSWALARLASVILGRGARKVDKNIWEKYKKK